MPIDVAEDITLTEGLEIVPLYFVLDFFESVGLVEGTDAQFDPSEVTEIDTITRVIGIT